MYNENQIKKYNGQSILISVILIMLSILLIIKPETFISIIMITLGIISVVSGIIQIILYFKSSTEIKAFSPKLIFGLISIIFGIILIFLPKLILGFIVYIIALWIILQSIIKIQIAINLKQFANSSWKIMLILSIITLLLGIFLLFNPFGFLQNFISIYGIFLLISEIINLFESIFMIKI